MKILVIGKGAREHALCWHFAESDVVDNIWVAPGNAGTFKTPKTKNLQLTTNNVDRLVDFAKSHQIDFCFIGTERSAAVQQKLITLSHKVVTLCLLKSKVTEVRALRVCACFLKATPTQNMECVFQTIIIRSLMLCILIRYMPYLPCFLKITQH